MMNKLVKQLKNIQKDNKGATAVEAAFCLPIVLFIGFCCYEYGIFINNATDLSDRFQSASRQVKLLDDPDESTLKSLFQSVVKEDNENIELTVSRVTRYDNNFVEVKMVYSHQIDVPFIRKYPMTSSYENLVLLSSDQPSNS